MTDDDAARIFAALDKMQDTIREESRSVTDKLTVLSERIAKMEQAETNSSNQRRELFSMVGSLQTSVAAFSAKSDVCEKMCTVHETRLEHLKGMADASDWDKEKAESLRNLLVTWDAITGAVRAAFSKVLIGVILVGMIGALAAFGVKVELPK